MIGVPPNTPAIGNIHRDILLLGIITTCHSKQLAVGLIAYAFWWYGLLSEDRDKF